MIVCEVHRAFYMANHMWDDPFPSCCDEFFDQEPIFTNEGTCYTTKKAVVETVASTVSSLKVWTMMDEEELPSWFRST